MKRPLGALSVRVGVAIAVVLVVIAAVYLLIVSGIR
jgi:hypothetical protein